MARLSVHSCLGTEPYLKGPPTRYKPRGQAFQFASRLSTDQSPHRYAAKPGAPPSHRLAVDGAGEGLGE